MATKIASYLQTHIQGEVLSSPSVRQHFATDASVLELSPQLVLYPRSTNDVRKVVRFSWQLAEKGHSFPLTPRGFGSDATGAAIGQGAILSFPSHMGQILELDTKQQLARVQPGVSISSLQETLHTHGLCFPPFTTYYPYSTVGGAIANGATSTVSQARGFVQEWVDKLEVVLANGEVIQTGRISKRDLEKKKGLPTLEGELYRAVDGVTNDYSESITAYKQATANVSNDNAGYRLADVIDRSGSCDLTPLFVNSQGTLGVITEIIIKLADYQPASSYVVACFDDADDAFEAALQCVGHKPVSMELLGKNLVNTINKERSSSVFRSLFDVDVSGSVLILELKNASKKGLFGNNLKSVIKKVSTKASNVSVRKSEDYELIEQLRAYRNAPYYIETAGKVAVPILSGCAVPSHSLPAFIDASEKLLKKHHLPAEWSCDVLSGHVTIFPLLDVSKVGGRQKLVTLMNEYFSLVWSHGGTIAGHDSDGRMKALYAAKQLGKDLTDANQEIKRAGDPHSIMNPGVKVGVDSKRLVSMLRKNYDIGAHADYLL